MNSLAGNKDRLAVSTRGKKYGVSFGGHDAGTRSQIHPCTVLPFPGTCAAQGGPAEPAARSPGASAATGLCVRPGGSAVPLAPGFFPSFRPFLSPHP
jgi:hypothetical protein